MSLYFGTRILIKNLLINAGTSSGFLIHYIVWYTYMQVKSKNNVCIYACKSKSKTFSSVCFYTPFHILAIIDLNKININLTKKFHLKCLIKRSLTCWKSSLNRYELARGIIDSLFGTRAHGDFPIVRREKDGQCSGSGEYPSHLGSGHSDYEHTGVDVVIDSGKTVLFCS